MQAISRRTFFALTACSLCAAGCDSESPSDRARATIPTRIGSVKDFSPGVKDFEMYRIRLFCRETPTGKAFSAISSTCTHMTCIVNRMSDNSFTCPCHGSRFDAHGKVVVGPAPKPLPWFELTVAADQSLYVHFDRPVESSWSLNV